MKTHPCALGHLLLSAPCSCGNLHTLPVQIVGVSVLAWGPLGLGFAARAQEKGSYNWPRVRGWGLCCYCFIPGLTWGGGWQASPLGRRSGEELRTQERLVAAGQCSTLPGSSPALQPSWGSCSGGGATGLGQSRRPQMQPQAPLVLASSRHFPEHQPRSHGLVGREETIIWGHS